MHSLMSELHPHHTVYSGDDCAVDGAGDAEHPDAGLMRREHVRSIVPVMTSMVMSDSDHAHCCKACLC